MYAGHRDSYDHVVADLMERYNAIVEAAGLTHGWATSVKASRPPMTLMGSIEGIKAIAMATAPEGATGNDSCHGDEVTVPTLVQAPRVKAPCRPAKPGSRLPRRGCTLADRQGIHDGANVLRHLDEFYLDRSGEDDSVVTALVQRPAEPNSRDSEVTRHLDRYQGLLPRLQDWESVTTMCHTLPARFCKEATHDADVPQRAG